MTFASILFLACGTFHGCFGGLRDALSAALPAQASPAELGRELERAKGERRDDLVRKLRDLGWDARPALEGALRVRRERAMAAWAADKGGAALVGLATQRTELDRRRKRALEVIFDEERYVYPYLPPLADVEKARLYPSVQREVDERVGAVLELWSSMPQVELSKPTHAAIEELRFARRMQRELDLELGADAPPEWIEGIDPAASAVDLASFAWNATEARARARGREVIAQNRTHMEDALQQPDAPINEFMVRSIALTNDYRRAMGLCVLAWNAKLQAAAMDHARYMQKTGIMEHEQADPTMATPGLRMRFYGYDAGGGEVLYNGLAGPDGAHASWRSSSGHHRSLLAPKAREIGCAAAGKFWIQLIGDGDELADEADEE